MSVPRVCPVWLLVLIGWLVLDEGAHAGDHDLSHPEELWPVSYAQALDWIDRTPEVRSRIDAARGLVERRNQVTALPSDLMLSAEAGPRLGEGSTAAGRIGASQTFALAALGDARRGVLHDAARVLTAEQRSVRFARRSEVARAWLELSYAHKALEVATRERGLAEELARVTLRGVSLGELTAADAADASAYAAEAQLNQLAAEGALADARFELSRSLAVVDRLLDARGEPPQLSALSTHEREQLHARIAAVPAVIEQLRQIELVDARKRELQASHAPQLGVGVLLERGDAASLTALATATLSVPLRERATREHAELDATQRILHGNMEQARARAHVELERLIHDAEHAQRLVEYTERELMPAIDKGLQAREALFRAGESSVLELILARRSALVLRLRQERGRIDRAAALARLSELQRAVQDAP